jgi:hypothetical protein
MEALALLALSPYCTSRVLTCFTLLPSVGFPSRPQKIARLVAVLFAGSS